MSLTSYMSLLPRRYAKLEGLTLHSRKPGKAADVAAFQANAFAYDDAFEQQITHILRSNHSNPILRLFRGYLEII